MGPVHTHSGTNDPQSPLQINRDPSPNQEAPEVCVDTGGTLPSGAAGVTDAADEWPEADPGLTWEDYHPGPSIPKGYMLNEGADYIPFDIRLPNGELQAAKYIKLEYGEDPLIYGMIDGDPHQYVESFQAIPYPSAGPLRTYTSNQLEFFEDDHDLCPEIDAAVYRLYDKSAMAEVECYHTNKKKLKREYEELRQVQHNIWKRELTLGGCARRMAEARILQRVKNSNRSKMRQLMDDYKARRRGRRS